MFLTRGSIVPNIEWHSAMEMNCGNNNVS